MDLQTLVAAHVAGRRRTERTLSAEDQFYRDHDTRPRLLGTIAARLGTLLLLSFVWF